MILHSLHVLYDRLENDDGYNIAPYGYSLQKISFKVVLTPQGELFDIQDARESVQGNLRPKQVLVPGATKPSGSGVNPCLLWDNSGYLLGYKAADKNPKRTRQSFYAFRRKHLALESEIGSPAFTALCNFLRVWGPARASNYPVLEDAAIIGFGVFQIQGETKYVHQDPAVTRWWNTRPAAHTAESRGQCLVTGKESSLARLHPKIKGVAGAQSAGATIVGFNEVAYESYGKKQSYNAPVSEAVSFRYVTALNALLDGPMRSKHRLTLGDTTIAFWTERPTPTEDIFLRFFTKGSAITTDPSIQDEGLRQKLLGFLQALRKGREAYSEIEDAPNQTPFFVLGLAPNAARIAIRFFHRGTLAELLDNLRHHQNDIRITPGPSDPEFPSAWLLLKQVARDKTRQSEKPKEIPPILSGTFLRAIITGSRYPEGLYAAVVRRIGTGDFFNYARACVIKGYLNRNFKKEVSMSLDPERRDPPYLLGRLFATLEKTQKDALGESLNTTIRDSSYSAASSTPGIIFPRLLRTYQHHLAKLEGGHKVNREKLVQQILAPLDAFPAHLNLPDQGLFAIGYYHQTQDFYTKHGNEPED